MDSSLIGGRAESDIYRLNTDGEHYSDDSSSSSEEEEFVEEMHTDDDYIIDSNRLKQPPQSQDNNLPPGIASEWGEDDGAPTSTADGWEQGGIIASDQIEVTSGQHNNSTRVSFNVPTANNAAAAAVGDSTTSMHFQNPKRNNNNNINYTSPYPTQSLRQTTPSDSTLQQILTNDQQSATRTTDSNSMYGRLVGGLADNANTKTPQTTNATSAYHYAAQQNNHLAEVTPAFLRRAAQDLGATNNNYNSTNPPSSTNNLVPPNQLMSRHDSRNSSSNNLQNLPDSSFIGADASALDGTFVSIRDLDDDDDVPSVDDNRLWNKGGEGGDEFPSETTSLLSGRNNNHNNNIGNAMNGRMPWQGGFFGSQMEKEDRKERRKMMMRGRKGKFTMWIWTVKSLLFNSQQKNDMGQGGGGASNSRWDSNNNHHHPIGGENFMTQRKMHTSAGGFPRQRLFSQCFIGILCLHMALCGMHDLFLRYVSYRNPVDEDGSSAEVSWNGEGQYAPAYWMSFDGRVLNPFIGPGARTLTAFGACVPGLVLSKGQLWRVATSMLQTSSFAQLILHIWALKTAVGGLTGLEWKRGSFVALTLYLISAMIGLAWSIALEPGRLISASGMGIAGLLAATSVERACFPLDSKSDEDEMDCSGSPHKGHGDGGSNDVTSSSNEQFTFQPPNSQKKKRRNLNLGNSPSLILLLEILASWWGAYTSLVGTVLATMAGAAFGLLLFVGSLPPGSLDHVANQDLIFNESMPPPPPPRGSPDWRSDDDSADTSIGVGGPQAYKTPLMRRSILADEDDEEEPMGTRSTLRKRHVNGSSSIKTPGHHGRTISIRNKQPYSASRVIARLVGALVALLLTLIPASLVATGEGPTTEMTRASVLGCRPMRILYKEDDQSDMFECAGGCIPLSRERTARRNEGMKNGRCDTIGYRCWSQSGTMTLRNYEVPIGIYVVPSSDGSCGDNESGDDDGGLQNNDDANAAQEGDAYNGEVEGVQE